MKLSDSFTIKATNKEVWDVFMDAEKLGGCVPGCKHIRAVTPTQYEADMEVKVQFMTIKFQATGELKNPVEQESFEVEMVGKPFSLAGLFKTNLNIQLNNPKPQMTEVHYDMNLQMTGRLASLGDVLMRGTVKKAAKEFAANVQELFYEKQNS